MVEVSAAEGRADRRLYGIEFLRFGLSLTVVLFHYTYYAPTMGILVHPIEPLRTLELLGDYAVHIFFIISGLVIAFSLEGRSALEFLVARISRLLPALVICGLVTSAVMIAVQGNALGRLGTLVEAILFVPLYFGEGMVDAAYWSIVYEIRFYFIVFVLIAVARTKWLAEIITAAAILALCLFAFGRQTAFLGSYLLAQFGSYFALGIILQRALTGGWTLYLLAFTAVNLTLASFGGYQVTTWTDLLDGERAPLSLHLALTIGGFAVVLVLSYLTIPVRLKNIASTLGAISYPLYLFHQETGYVLINLWSQFMAPEAAVALVVLTAILFAYMVVISFERPYGRRLRNGLNRATWRLERALHLRREHELRTERD